MNSIVYGKIGSGKTHYSVQEFVIKGLKAGRTVYTNIDFGDPDNLRFMASYRFSQMIGKDCRTKLRVLSFDQLLYKLELNDMEGLSLRVKKNCIIVIDEAQMIFDYMGVTKVNKKIYHFFAYARHFGIDLVFVTQSPELLNRMIQGLANQFIEVHGKKQFSSGLKNYYSYAIRGSLRSFIIESSIKKYNQEVFKLYRSSLSDEDKRGQRGFFSVIPVNLRIMIISAILGLSWVIYTINQKGIPFID